MSSTSFLSSAKPFRAALVQMQVGADKQANLANARRLVLQAAAGKGSLQTKQHADSQNSKRVQSVVGSDSAGADMVVLPECFNSPYGTQFFAEYAEEASIAAEAYANNALGALSVPHAHVMQNSAGSETLRALSAMAKDAGVVLVGGSFPEKVVGSDGKTKYYNTCTIWGKRGELLAAHRKVHLFDVSVPGGITFRESDVLSPGNKPTTVSTPLGRIGIGICYDVRFPELAMMAARDNPDNENGPVVAMVYPGAFNMTTGPLHWHLLMRSRALDNQIYVFACSPARDESSSYVAYGHSLVADPMGRVVVDAGPQESIVYVDVDPREIETTRRSIPVSLQRRFDLYPDVSVNKK